MTLSNEDILDVVRSWSTCARATRSRRYRHLGNRACAVGELAENQYRSGLARSRRPSRNVWGRPRTEALMPHDLINSSRSAPRSRIFGAAS